MKCWNVWVLSGGVSPERDVSLESGRDAANALRALGHHVTVVDPASPDVWHRLLAANPDVVFSALHGGSGENGVVQATLATLGLAFTGSEAHASALAMDKHAANLLCQEEGLPVIPWRCVRQGDVLDPSTVPFPLPWCVKPRWGGSSLGVTCVEALEQLPEALDQVRAFNDDALVLPWVTGQECTVGVVDGWGVLPSVRIEPVNHQYYDYDAKYKSHATRYHTPAGLPPAVEDTMQALARRVYQTLGCRHYARVDFLWDPVSERLHLLELNTLPGITKGHSLLPMMAAAAGRSYEELIQHLTTMATST